MSASEGFLEEVAFEAGFVERERRMVSQRQTARVGAPRQEVGARPVWGWACCQWSWRAWEWGQWARQDPGGHRQPRALP